MVGGAALSPALRTAAESAGVEIIETYGMTETCGGCVYEGQALNGVEFAITDNGVIKIRGSVLASDYLNSLISFNFMMVGISPMILES